MNNRILAAALAVAASLTVFPLAAFGQNAALPPPPAAAVTVPAGAVTLRLKFAPGQIRRYKTAMTMNGTILTGQSGAGIPMNMTMEATLRQTVKDVRAADGAATIEAQIETIKMSMNGKEMPMTPEQQAPMKKPYTSVLLPTGKILSVQMPPMPSGGMPGMDFSKMLSAGSTAFPDAAVKIGDTWNGTVAAGMTGFKMLVTSALVGVDTANGGQMATINQNLNGDMDMILSKNMPVTMKMTGKMTGNGVEVFDAAAGEIAWQNMTVNITLLMHFTPPAGQAAPAGMPQAMNMNMRETVKTERLGPAAPTIPPVQ